MKKSIVLIAAFGIIAVLSSSCRKIFHCIEGKGPVVTRDINIASFDKIDVQGSMDVHVIQGETQGVKVTGQENILDRLETNVAGGSWMIKLKDNCYNGSDISVYIVVPKMTEAKVNGSGDIELGNFTNQSDLTLNVNGSGSIRFGEFTGTQNLRVKINGSGDVQGLFDFPDLVNVGINISGSGEYQGFPLGAENVDVSLSGSGSARITASSKLDVKISGSGDVYYKGYPSINSSISGSGKVINAN